MSVSLGGTSCRRCGDFVEGRCGRCAADLDGAALKELRTGQGFALADLGYAVGVSHQTVHEWERGRRGPGGEHLARLADVLGVPVGELVRGEEVA